MGFVSKWHLLSAFLWVLFTLRGRNQRGSAICGSKTTMPNGFYSNQQDSDGGVSFAILIDPDEIPP